MGIEEITSLFALPCVNPAAGVERGTTERGREVPVDSSEDITVDAELERVAARMDCSPRGTIFA